MNKHLTIACSIASLAIASSMVLAQSTLAAHPAETIAAQLQAGEPASRHAIERNSQGSTYLSGGAGSEERSAMEVRRDDFPLKLVLSSGNGDYIVAETVRLTNADGKVVLDAREAGPWVMLKAPKGSYKLEASYKGQTRTQQVDVDSNPTRISLNFPGSS